MGTPFTSSVPSIAEDNRPGAAQIAERAADILLRRATSGEASSPDAFRRELLLTGWALIQAHTVVAPLVNLVNTVLWKIEESETPQALREAVTQAATAFKRQLRQHALDVAEGALGLIGDGHVVVTLSYSSTVQHALCHAQRAGRRLDVIVAESNPGGEGHATAQVLANCGVPVKVLCEADAFGMIARADLVLVGADMLTNRGLVNKIGSLAMAKAAHAAGKPFYTLCGSEKFLPPGFQPPVVTTTSVQEAQQNRTGDSHPDMPVDFTPLELLSGIVTEQGILPVEGIEAWLATSRLHPALAAYASDLGSE